MIKEFIGTGKTIEEATLSAKTGLNAPLTADVKIEVIQMPEKKKFFGLIGGADAKVKASYDDGKRDKASQRHKASKKQTEKKSEPKAEKKQTEKKSEPKAEKKQTEKKSEPKAEKKQTEKKSEPKTEKKHEKQQTAPKAEEPKPYQPAEAATEKDIDLDGACAYLKTILDGLNLNDVKLSARIEDDIVKIDIDCEEYGIIIGRRGETLDALQYLTGLAIKNVTNKYVRVSLNVSDYREKREETLRALAVKNANYVIRSGRRYIFEPMNPYERRIIHTAVQDVDGATSRSVGSGMDRRVLIEPEGGVKYYGRSSAPKRAGDHRFQTQSAPADPNREKKVDRADIPKFGKIEINRD